MWFVPAIPYGAAQIGRMTTAGTVTEFPLPNPLSYPQNITDGPDGTLWFTDLGTNMIGRITTTGAVTEFPVPTPMAGLFGIKKGTDGALWFIEANANAIGRMTTSGVVSEFLVPTSGSGIGASITEGPDGAMWFTEGSIFGNSAIGRISGNGNITEYPVTFNSRPYGITTGPDAALWFTNSNAGNIGRITTAGVVSYYPGYGSGIAMDHGGTLWLASDIGNGGVYTPGVVEQIIFETATLAVTPASGFVGSTLSFTGSGFVPNQTVQIYNYAVGTKVLAAATADSTGAIAVSAAVPPSAYLFGSPRLFLGLGTTSGKLGAASFSVEARLNPNPNSGTAGSTVKVSGSGFAPYEEIRIVWGNPTTLLGTVVADLNGSFNGSNAFQFTVPADATPGAHGVAGVNTYGGANGHGWFTVQ
jgi:streptogramin lyase